jgi:hypothetical protein
MHFFLAYHGLKSCASFSGNGSVPTRNVKNLSEFGSGPSNEHRPSAQYANAANVPMGKHLDIFAVYDLNVLV